MARTVDWNARRKARAEAQGDPVQLLVGDDRFTLPVELPLETLDLMAEGKFRDAVTVLLGSEAEMRRLFAHRPTAADLEDLMAMYGDPGESSASLPSAPAIGRRSRPTSTRPTKSTSERSATAPTGAEPAGS